MAEDNEYHQSHLIPDVPSRSTTWVIHPDYLNVNFFAGSDIALIRVTDGLTFNDRVKPVCKPSLYPAAGNTLTVMGWGVTDNGEISDVLRTVSMIC